LNVAAHAYYSATALLDGDPGTEQTIDAIRGLLSEAWKDSCVNRTAIDILRASGAQQYDSLAQLQALYAWVLAKMYFVNDPVTKEALRPARDLLALGAGDCDDINAILLPALVGSVGFEPRLVTIAADADHPESFSHIYAEAKLNDAWVAIDAARPGAQFGIAPNQWYRREWWSLVDGSHGMYPGAGRVAPPGMSGMGVSRMRGLGQSVSTDISNAIAEGSQAASGIINAIDGNPVYGVVGPAYGPGGSSLFAAPTAASLSASASIDPSLLWIGVGLVALWALSKGKR
jgi:hypothetical protein